MVRLALLGSVTWSRPSLKPPDQEAVDRAESQFAALGAFARTLDVIEQPRDFRAAEIGVGDQAGDRLDARVEAFAV